MHRYGLAGVREPWEIWRVFQRLGIGRTSARRILQPGALTEPHGCQEANQAKGVARRMVTA
jgi:hypothetical protein